MIILLGGQKGGTGKTTIAVNLSVYFVKNGFDVLLVDADSQRTAANWAFRREDYSDVEKITCIEKTGNIYKSVVEIAKKYDITIVDTAGADSKEFRTGLLAADILITPVQPSQYDFETLAVVLERIDQAKEINPDLLANILITKAPTVKNSKLLKQTKEALQELKETNDINIFSSINYERTIYKISGTEGAGVLEQTEDKKAKEEFVNFAKEIGGDRWQPRKEQAK